jgi:sporulation protein YlmC with PRC-barrel domain
MRGDGNEIIEGELCLAECGKLKGIPVFASTGKCLGTLDGTVLHRSSGAITSVVLVQRRLFGLLNRRIVLPRAALQTVGANGGFVVEWPQRNSSTDTPGLPDDAPLMPWRLDPAREE